MNTRLTILMIAGFLTFGASAQAVFGLKAGGRYCIDDKGFKVWTTSSTGTRTEYSGIPTGLGYQFGCYVISSARAAASFRAELVYGSKRMRQLHDITTALNGDTARRDQVTYTAVLNYLEIPLLISLGHIKGLSFQFGLCPSLRLTGETKVRDQVTLMAPGYSENADVTATYDHKGHIGGFVLDAQVGVRYGIGRGTEVVLAYVRDMTNSYAGHVGMFQLSAGYFFVNE
jgi:hypothetical protein